MIQVLYERWKANPKSEYSKYYLAGGYAVRDHPFQLGWRGGVLPNDDLSL